MRDSGSWVLSAVLVAVLACGVCLGVAPRAESSPLCAPAVTQTVTVPANPGRAGTCSYYYGTAGTCTTNADCATGGVCTGYVRATPAQQQTITYSGFQLRNGQCTNAGGGGPDPAAFSGAALASQALSELSQSATQETARSAENSIASRREQEQQSCAAGFSRVDGVCERNPAPVAEAPAAEPEPAPAPERPRKKAKKAAAVQAGEPVEAPAGKRKAHKAASAREAEPPAAPKVAYVRKAPLVSKDYPPPIEPAIRYGVWGQAFGEYEKRNASGMVGIVGPDFNGGLPLPLNTSVTSQTGTVGFQAGADLTSRGLIAPNDGVIAGVLVGYLSNHLTLNTDTAGVPGVADAGSSHLTATLSGPTVGVYATYFAGGFSTDLLAKLDILSLNQNSTDNLGFAGPAGPFGFVFSSAGSTSVVDSTVAANLNYRFDIYPNFWIQPTVGVQFTALSYGGGAAALGLEDGQQVMIQGGARVGTTSVFSKNILLTSTLTGLAYDDVVVNGGFIPGASFNGNNILANADRGQVRGRGILAFNFDFGKGVTSFVQGDVHGGKGLFGAGGKAGIRYQW